MNVSYVKHTGRMNCISKCHFQTSETQMQASVWLNEWVDDPMLRVFFGDQTKGFTNPNFSIYENSKFSYKERLLYFWEESPVELEGYVKNDEPDGAVFVTNMKILPKTESTFMNKMFSLFKHSK